jgi:MFS family permease
LLVTFASRRTRRAMHLNTIEGGFATAAENLAAPYLSLFALALGATPSQIGMLTAFPNLIGNILQIPMGLWSERMQDKRLLPIVGGYLSRSTWALLAVIPFLVPPQYRVGVVILLATFRVLMANIGVPAWTALQADLVPKSIRGRYYANRNIICNMSALLATIAATFLLGLRFPLNFQIIFGGAAALGLTATYIFSTIDFAQSAPKEKRTGIPFSAKVRGFLGEVGTQKAFCSYVVSSLLWNFGVNLAASLFVVYFVEDLGGAPGFWAVFSGVNLATQVLIHRYWGRLADRFGQKNVMLASGVGAVFIPLFWLVTRNTWFPLIIYVINGLAWGGYNPAAFNLLLEITPDDHRTVYVGAYNTLMGVAMAAGPLVGGFAAEALDLRFIFGASFLVRGLALYLFHRTVRDTGSRRLRMRDLVLGSKAKELDL